MGNVNEMNEQELKIQGLIGRYLASRMFSTANPLPHLDEDSLAAFTEGTLTLREAEPVIGHLTECSFCRGITAELVRFDLAFSQDDNIAPITESREPAKISEVLSGLLSKIFGTNDGTVFAHTEPDEKSDKPDKSEKE